MDRGRGKELRRRRDKDKDRRRVRDDRDERRECDREGRRAADRDRNYYVEGYDNRSGKGREQLKISKRNPVTKGKEGKT